MGPIWRWQDPGGLHVGHMNFAIWDPLWEISWLKKWYVENLICVYSDACQFYMNKIIYDKMSGFLHGNHNISIVAVYRQVFHNLIWTKVNKDLTDAWLNNTITARISINPCHTIDYLCQHKYFG